MIHIRRGFITPLMFVQSLSMASSVHYPAIINHILHTLIGCKESHASPVEEDYRILSV